MFGSKKQGFGFVAYLISSLVFSMIVGGFIYNDPLAFTMIIHTSLALLGISFFLNWLLKTPVAKANCDFVIRGMFWFALVYYLLFIVFSSPFAKESDIVGHFEYIEFLFDGIFPHPNQGWQTYQPPLYYILVLPFYALGRLLDIPEPFDIVRYFSVICYLVFLLYSTAFMKIFIKDNRFVYIGLALLILWPIGVFYSGKINNDILANTLFIPSIYYFTAWYKNNRSEYLWYSIIVALIAVGTKSIGLVLCGSLFLAAVIRLLNREVKFTDLKPKSSLLIIAVIIGALSFGSNFGRTILHKSTQQQDQQLLVGNMTNVKPEDYIAAYIKDDNIQNYISFDLGLFINEPYALIYEDGDKERLLFWNTMLKTSIIGIGGWALPTLAKIILSCYLLMLIYMLATFCFFSRKFDKRFLIAGISSIAGIAALMTMRVTFPVTGFAEARYLHYIIPILICFFMRSVEWHSENHNKMISISGKGLAIFMVITFLIFMIVQYAAHLKLL